jgi:hypothetical protein
MRRLFLILLASVLLVPGAAFARDRATGDGSLQVADASARVIYVQGTGVIFGHFDWGVLTVVEPYDPVGLTAPQISGAPSKIVGNSVRYSGSDVRFLFPNGRYTLKFEGIGLDISAVGKGTVTAAGLGTPDDGDITVNGGKPQQLGLNVISASFGAKKESSPASAKDNSGNSSNSGKPH